MPTNPFSAIGYVTGGLTLLAFIVACVVLVLRKGLDRDKDLLEKLPPQERGRGLEQLLREIRIVKPGSLEDPERLYQLALEELAHRARRLRTIVVAAVVAFSILLLATVVSFIWAPQRSSEIWCPEGFQLQKVAEMSINFCMPRGGWEVDEGHLGAKKPDLYVRWGKDPDVHLQFHLDVVPPPLVGRAADYVAKMESTWKQIDPSLTGTQRPWLGRPGYQFLVRHKDAAQKEKFYELYGVFSDREHHVEAFLSYFVSQREDAVVEEMRQIVSSMVLVK